MSLPYEIKAEDLIRDGRTSQEFVEEVKNWLKTTDLPELQDETVVLFLIASENNLSKVQRMIKNYFKIMCRAPEIFTERDIDSHSLKKARDVVISCNLPKHLNKTSIQLFRLCDSDYKKFVLADASKLAAMQVHVHQKRQIPDDNILIIDMDGISLMHLTRIKVGVLKNIIEFVQEGMPSNIQKIHILNANYIAEKALNVARLFINSQLAAKVHSTSMSMQEFHEKCIPATHLPQEYGGELPSYKELQKVSIREFRELRQFYDAEEKLIRKYSSNK